MRCDSCAMKGAFCIIRGEICNTVWWLLYLAMVVPSLRTGAVKQSVCFFVYYSGLCRWKLVMTLLLLYGMQLWAESRRFIPYDFAMVRLYYCCTRYCLFLRVLHVYDGRGRWFGVAVVASATCSCIIVEIDSLPAVFCMALWCCCSPYLSWASSTSSRCCAQDDLARVGPKCQNRWLICRVVVALYSVHNRMARDSEQQASYRYCWLPSSPGLLAQDVGFSQSGLTISRNLPKSYAQTL